MCRCIDLACYTHFPSNTTQLVKDAANNLEGTKTGSCKNCTATARTHISPLHQDLYRLHKIFFSTLTTSILTCCKKFSAALSG